MKLATSEAIAEAVNQANSSMNTAFQQLTRLGSATDPALDFDAPIPGIERSIARLRSLAQNCLAEISEQFGSGRDLDLYPQSRLSALVQSLDEFSGNWDTVSNQVGNVSPPEDARRVFDRENFQIVDRANNAVIWQMAPALQNVWHSYQRMLVEMPELKFGSNTKGIAFREQLMQQMEQLTAAAADAREELLSHARTALRNENRANNAAERAEIAEQQAQERALSLASLAESASQSTQLIEQRRSTSEAVLLRLDEIRQVGEVLSASIDTAQSRLREFDASMSARSDEIERGRLGVEEARAKLAEVVASSEKIIDDARGALGWATAQGLSKSFAEEAGKLKSEIWWAQILFFGSIAILAAWVAGLFGWGELIGLHLPALGPQQGLTGFDAVLVSFAGVGVRLLLVLPALWLVVFMNRRYRELYIAHEQYVFKQTVASAIPGFKAEAAGEDANDHVKAMTTAAFERLLFNPREASARELVDGKKSGPLSGWLYRIVSQAVRDARPAD